MNGDELCRFDVSVSCNGWLFFSSVVSHVRDIQGNGSAAQAAAHLAPNAKVSKIACRIPGPDSEKLLVVV